MRKTRVVKIKKQRVIKEMKKVKCEVEYKANGQY